MCASLFLSALHHRAANNCQANTHRHTHPFCAHQACEQQAQLTSNQVINIHIENWNICRRSSFSSFDWTKIWFTLWGAGVSLSDYCNHSKLNLYFHYSNLSIASPKPNDFSAFSIKVYPFESWVWRIIGKVLTSFYAYGVQFLVTPSWDPLETFEEIK